MTSYQLTSLAIGTYNLSLVVSNFLYKEFHMNSCVNMQQFGQLILIISYVSQYLIITRLCYTHCNVSYVLILMLTVKNMSYALT